MRTFAAILAATALSLAAALKPLPTALLAERNVTGLCTDTGSYAGYVNIDNNSKQYFYWGFESQSNPADDPIVLWMTGGPGCSSELALLFENGPCKVNDWATGTVPNPYSWNTKANLLYIDQPAGVGFSTGEENDKDEEGVAADMYAFLQGFFKEHPELADNKFFVVGESYGGHYAPATAHGIWQRNQAPAAGDIKINLAGLAVGNGLTDPEIQYQYYPEMAYTQAIKEIGHATVSESTYQSMKQAVPGCVKLIQQCQTDHSTCSTAQFVCNQELTQPYYATGLNPYDISEPCRVPGLCYNFTNVDQWLNSASTQAALGVSGKWQSCNYQVNSDFSADWMRNYQQDVPPLLGDNIPVLIYAGDYDFICNWLGNQAWTLALDWSGKAAFNAATPTSWVVNGAAAGEVRSAGGFHFLRVYKAGHMVPHDQPAAALQMLNTFISGGKF